MIIEYVDLELHVKCCLDTNLTNMYSVDYYRNDNNKTYLSITTIGHKLIIDNVTIEDSDILLLINQDYPRFNGLWKANINYDNHLIVLSRPNNFKDYAIPRTLVFVKNGENYMETEWILVGNEVLKINHDDLCFERITRDKNLINPDEYELFITI